MHFSRYDVIIVKFPFASSLKYKARPAVVLSDEQYNQNEHHTLLIMAISSNTDTPFSYELPVKDWQSAGLLKPSIFKAAIATIEQAYVIQKVGRLSSEDSERLESILKQIICIAKEQ